jgi:hypothetical protein
MRLPRSFDYWVLHQVSAASCKLQNLPPPPPALVAALLATATDYRYTGMFDAPREN